MSQASDQEQGRVKHAVQAGLLGGVIGGLISGLLNYYALPFPASPFDNAMGHGVGGLICGFIAGFVGVLGYASRAHPSA